MSAYKADAEAWPCSECGSNDVLGPVCLSCNPELKEFLENGPATPAPPAQVGEWQREAVAEIKNLAPRVGAEFTPYPWVQEAIESSRIPASGQLNEAILAHNIAVLSDQQATPAPPVGEWSDDEILKALRDAGFDDNDLSVLTVTRWKDGIDLEYPRPQLKRLFAIIAKHAPSAPAPDKLVAALERAAKRMDNCRGAISSGQIVDKEVEKMLALGRDEARAALSAHRKENP